MDEAFVIDLWSDVVCPFCYLGSRQLTLALEQFEHRDLVVVRPRAFELDPRPHEESGLPLSELSRASTPWTSARFIHCTSDSKRRRPVLG